MILKVGGVGRSNILLMEEIRLPSWYVVYPILCKVLYIPGGANPINSISSFCLVLSQQLFDNVIKACFRLARTGCEWTRQRSHISIYKKKKMDRKAICNFMAGDTCEIVKLCVAYIIWPPPKMKLSIHRFPRRKLLHNPPFAGNSGAIFARSACASIAFALGPVERPERMELRRPPLINSPWGVSRDFFLE